MHRWIFALTVVITFMGASLLSPAKPAAANHLSTCFFTIPALNVSAGPVTVPTTLTGPLSMLIGSFGGSTVCSPILP